jgi:hypothetical protein
MAKKAKKKVVAKVATRSRKTKKAIAVKSAPKARKAVAKKAARKATRRSSADTAKLQKAVLKGLKAGKPAAVLADELGISRPYVYMLKNKG